MLVYSNVQIYFLALNNSVNLGMNLCFHRSFGDLINLHCLDYMILSQLSSFLLCLLPLSPSIFTTIWDWGLGGQKIRGLYMTPQWRAYVSTRPCGTEDPSFFQCSRLFHPSIQYSTLHVLVLLRISQKHASLLSPELPPVFCSFSTAAKNITHSLKCAAFCFAGFLLNHGSVVQGISVRWPLEIDLLKNPSLRKNGYLSKKMRQIQNAKRMEILSLKIITYSMICKRCFYSMSNLLQILNVMKQHEGLHEGLEQDTFLSFAIRLFFQEFFQ